MRRRLLQRLFPLVSIIERQRQENVRSKRKSVYLLTTAPVYSADMYVLTWSYSACRKRRSAPKARQVTMPANVSPTSLLVRFGTSM